MYTLELVKGNWYDLGHPELKSSVDNVFHSQSAFRFHESPEGRPRVSIDKDNITVGRNISSDIMIFEPYIHSGTHCWLRKFRGSAYLDSLQALGTSIIGEKGTIEVPVLVTRHAFIQLRIGDTIRFGGPRESGNGVEIKLVEL